MANQIRLEDTIYTVIQWKKNGDHPDDDVQKMKNPDTGETFKSEGKVVRRFNHPTFHAQLICPHCGKIMSTHGWLDFPPEGQTVCPGDFVITNQVGEHFALKPSAYAALHPQAISGV